MTFWISSWLSVFCIYALNIANITFRIVPSLFQQTFLTAFRTVENRRWDIWNGVLQASVKMRNRQHFYGNFFLYSRGATLIKMINSKQWPQNPWIISLRFSERKRYWSGSSYITSFNESWVTVWNVEHLLLDHWFFFFPSDKFKKLNKTWLYKKWHTYLDFWSILSNWERNWSSGVQ